MKNAGRVPILAANWKMNMLRAEAERYCEQLLAGLGTPQVDIILYPPFPLLWPVSRCLEGSSVRCGGQDLHVEASGAYTGDVAAPQLVDAGCTWVLCGHSERRQGHGEDDALVGRKARVARDHGLTPMICLGERGDERRAGRTFEVLGRQLREALAERPLDFELAYEPVWAIGTGDTATPEVAQEAHAFLRSELATLLGASRAAATRILYGGSANPENVAALIAQEDIDGFLVGGAGLDPQKFLAMIGRCDGRA